MAISRLASSFCISDILHLWYLASPTQPLLIVALCLVLNGRGVSLRYCDQWLRNGFALSVDLPLSTGEFMPRSKDVAAGAVDDARPDRWGERIIRLMDQPFLISQRKKLC